MFQSETLGISMCLFVHVKYFRLLREIMHLEFDVWFNVCFQSTIDVMMVGSKPRFPKKSCALYAGN